jgi:type VI secretion system secreted protein Hcp
MRKLSIAISVLVLSVAAAAQGPPQVAAKPQASIEAKLTGLTCTTAAGTATFAVQAWSWGASNSSTFTSGGGSGAGKANIQDLSVSKKFDECSPSLFGGVATGKHFTSLLLTSEDDKGNVVSTVTLTDVLITSWSIGGSTANATPVENVTFAFAKVCLAETAGGTKFCWDIEQNKSF